MMEDIHGLARVRASTVSTHATHRYWVVFEVDTFDLVDWVVVGSDPCPGIPQELRKQDCSVLARLASVGDVILAACPQE